MDQGTDAFMTHHRVAPVHFVITGFENLKIKHHINQRGLEAC